MARYAVTGGQFNSVVTKLVVPPPESEEPKVKVHYYKGLADLTGLLIAALWLFLVVTPLIVIAGLSNWLDSSSSSTSAERGWIMSWLAIGSMSSLWTLVIQSTFVRGNWDVAKLYQPGSIRLLIRLLISIVLVTAYVRN